jgi:hypothetical protein
MIERLGIFMKLKDLEYFRSGYPRVFFFRPSEHFACGKISFEEWERIFIRLMGIMGKVTKEEPYIPFIAPEVNPAFKDEALRDQAKEYFVRFKKRHPEQLVLLHYNGDDRDTKDNIEKFSAGHWLYYIGCRITEDVPIEEDETEIHIEDPTLFHINTGSGPYNGGGEEGGKRLRKEDIGLCMIDGEGKPDWNMSEQVKLIAVDLDRKVIKVKRGCYGTKPLAFPTNRSYAAAHCYADWYPSPNILWRYNYSTLCPNDSKGRTAADILLNELVSRFSSGGDLEVFDGLEFDVLFGIADVFVKYAKNRGIDTNGDGNVDNGWINGVNYFQIGVYDFLKRLRRRLGEERIIQADVGVHMQRAFGILNGVESEGWPNQRSLKIDTWSNGVNDHFFWSQNARKPSFSYIAHKLWASRKGGTTWPLAPFHLSRLIFAAVQCFGSGICYYAAPDPEPGEAFGIWDELKKGIEHEKGWLGQPLASAVRLALKEKDLLDGTGKKISAEFVERFQGEDIQFGFEKTNNSIRVSTKKRKAQLIFNLVDVPCNGSELFISFKIKAEPMELYPIDIARPVWVRLVNPDGSKYQEKFRAWCNPSWFEASFYFREVNSSKVNIEFTVENSEPIWISDLSVHAHPDAMYRIFEKGLVLANPSNHDYTFNIEKIDPNRKYRRLIGSSKQDTKTNDGSPIGKTVTLKPLDGLFLVTTK